MAELTLANIAEGGLCSGCGACSFIVADGSLDMRLDAAGYVRPYPDRSLSAEEGRGVRAICPGIGLAHDATSDRGVRYHQFWGPTVRVSAGHAKDDAVHFRGSSGSVLSALVDWKVLTADEAFASVINAYHERRALATDVQKGLQTAHLKLQPYRDTLVQALQELGA